MVDSSYAVLFRTAGETGFNGPHNLKYLVYRVDDMFVDDNATYVSLNWLEISKFPLDMMYPYWWTTHMQKMSPLSI
jgi:hypothetical protein